MSSPSAKWEQGTEEHAGALSFAQAKAWVHGKYGQRLTGLEAEEIVMQVMTIMIPTLKISAYAQLADAVRENDPRYAELIDEVVAGAIKEVTRG